MPLISGRAESREQWLRFALVALPFAIVSLLAGCQSRQSLFPSPVADVGVPRAKLAEAATPTSTTSVPLASPETAAPQAGTPAAGTIATVPIAATPALAPPTATPPQKPEIRAPTPSSAQANTALMRVEGRLLSTNQLTNLAFAADELRLASRADGTYQSNGTATSAEFASAFAFDTVVLSWNGPAPRGTSLRFELRAHVGDEWTPWYVMGTWSESGGSSAKDQTDKLGSVDVDTLKLRRPAVAMQYRVNFSTSDPKQTPSLRLVSLAYADMSRPLAGPRRDPPNGWARELAVPTFSQLAEDESIARQICSPTSLAMVLGYYGQNKKVAEVVQGVRDATAGIFGNWPLNTAYAGQLGFDAYVDRFYSAELLKTAIAASVPPIISIKFGPGELSNSPLNETSGHLIVVRGFTPEGDVIVNDPFGATAGEVRRVYKRAELEKIWLRSGGVVYMIRRRL